MGRKEPCPKGEGITETEVGGELLPKVDPGTLGRGGFTYLDLRGDVCGGCSWDELWTEKKDLLERDVVVIASGA